MTNHHPNKTIVVFLWIVSIIAIGFIIILTGLDQSKGPVQVQSEGSSQAGQIKSTIDLTPENFKIEFNKAMISLDSELSIKSLNIQPGVIHDTFNIKLTKNVSILGSVDGDGILRSVSVIGLGDGSLDDDIDTMKTIAAIIIALNPGYTINDCYALMKDIGLAHGYTSSQKVISINGKKYWFTKTSDQKTIFSVNTSMK